MYLTLLGALAPTVILCAFLSFSSAIPDVISSSTGVSTCPSNHSVVSCSISGNFGLLSSHSLRVKVLVILKTHALRNVQRFVLNSGLKRDLFPMYLRKLSSVLQFSSWSPQASKLSATG